MCNVHSLEDMGSYTDAQNNKFSQVRYCGHQWVITSFHWVSSWHPRCLKLTCYSGPTIRCPHNEATFVWAIVFILITRLVSSFTTLNSALRGRKWLPFYCCISIFGKGRNSNLILIKSHRLLDTVLIYNKSTPFSRKKRLTIIFLIRVIVM